MAKNSLFPIVVLFIVVGILALIGFVVYSIVQDISNKTKAKMEKKHIMVSKDGMKVSMKEVNDEDYKDQTQSVLVNVWNYSTGNNGNSDGATSEDKDKLKKRRA